MAKKATQARRKKKKKYVYFFGGGKAEGAARMKNLLGGKGANLAEMASLGVPVPAGFTITTEVCTHFMLHKGKYPAGLRGKVSQALGRVEKLMGMKFGDPANPLLVSCRSGARQSMPGMMETVLNIGLTTRTIPGLIEKTGNPRFVWDAYRRLITMYSDVVMEKAAGIEPEEGHGIRQQLEHELNQMKKARGVKQDTELTTEDLQELCETYKAKVEEVLGKPFPDNARDQLWGGIGAVFRSWNGKRAVAYRRIEGIPDEWGTATNVQAMVFGNMGNTSATGVAFTRNPATGNDEFYGEWLPNAQGEDVVAGTRTPNPLNERTRPPGTEHLPSLETAMPEAYKELVEVRNALEHHYRDMQDLEFTIQEGTLWLLQTRTGKRNCVAAVKMAMQDYRRKWITQDEALLRVKADQITELLLPMLDPKEEKKNEPMASGLPAGPGGANGQVVFTADDAVEWAAQKGDDGEKRRVILVREETNPEDVHGMHAAQAILTARGGMTSHAALVARAWGKCCIVGAGDLEIDARKKQLSVNGTVIKEGEWISLNGTAGKVYAGQIPLVPSPIIQVIEGRMDPKESPVYKGYSRLMKWADRRRKLGVRANADTPEDARRALQFGAAGIGLFRTEHMFYGKGSAEPLFLLRKMILSGSEEERRAALDELFPHVKADIKATLKAMGRHPVTIRLLDPPLHEFVPSELAEREKLAKSLGISVDEIARRAELLRETNPMMGHRGVRLGVTYPEVSEMQIRAVLEAAAELAQDGVRPHPEIMIPVLCDLKELQNQANLVKAVHTLVCEKVGVRKVPHLVGTMIEIPRAALLANEIARTAEFFSFGTNDLTQMTFGFSRDDIGGFMPDYLSNAVLPDDPFQVLDRQGVGELVDLGIQRGRATQPKLKVGICGEHGGEPSSVVFCHQVGMDYVSCSPFRVPIARLAAAQAVVQERAASPKGKGKKKSAKKRKKSATRRKRSASRR